MGIGGAAVSAGETRLPRARAVELARVGGHSAQPFRPGEGPRARERMYWLATQAGMSNARVVRRAPVVVRGQRRRSQACSMHAAPFSHSFSDKRPHGLRPGEKYVPTALKCAFRLVDRRLVLTGPLLSRPRQGS